MRVLLLSLAASALLPAAASAAIPSNLPTDVALDCFQTRSQNTPGVNSWDTASRGTLQLNTGGQNGSTPTSYTFEAPFMPAGSATEGGWHVANRTIQFDDGPLADEAHGFRLVGRVFRRRQGMQHDRIPHRTFPIQIRSLTEQKASDAPAFDQQTDPDINSYWFCGKPGVAPRDLFANDLGWVSKRTGIDATVPTWVETLGDPSGAVGRVRVAKKGYYRLMVCLDDKPAKSCDSDAIFSAKRAPASQLGHRTRVKLAKGLHGWGGNYGCAFNGTDPDWGPLLCGRVALVWHAKGVNYAVEAPAASLGDEVRWANQLIRG